MGLKNYLVQHILVIRKFNNGNGQSSCPRQVNCSQSATSNCYLMATFFKNSSGGIRWHKWKQSDHTVHTSVYPWCFHL